MLDKLITAGNTFLSSKAITVLLSVVLTTAIYFYIDSKLTIKKLEKENKELIATAESSKLKVLAERERCNNDKEKEILNKNISVLNEENERLKLTNKMLAEKENNTFNDNLKINNELNKLRNKKCLNSVIDDDMVESLNNIFNGG